MSEEQRFRWAERLFWDLNFLPQMGQSGTPGGGGGEGGAGACSSLSSKHLQMEIILLLSVRQDVNSADQSSRQMSGGGSQSSMIIVSKSCISFVRNEEEDFSKRADKYDCLQLKTICQIKLAG